MLDPLDALDLADDKRLMIVADGDGLAAVPAVRDPDGQWRRARAGDGVAEALLNVLAEQSGTATRGGFTIQSWTQRTALGERAIDVDQTNESVIVGDTAVVKWAAHLQEGPHPAPRRIAVLREAGFDGMPTPWGLVTWRPADGEETLAASVDEYLPGAVDGWTWAVEVITDAASDRHPDRAFNAARKVGWLVAELHAALAHTATVATQADAMRWRDAALEDTGSGLRAAGFGRVWPWPASVGTKSRRSSVGSARWQGHPSSKGTATSTWVRCCAVRDALW